jgi:hypothetical protein
MIRKALGHVISCREASRLASRSQDFPLPAWQRWLLRLHLAACSGCARLERQMRFLRRAMHAYRQ